MSSCARFYLGLLRHDPVVVDDVVVGVDAGVGGEHSGRLLEVEQTGREEAHGQCDHLNRRLQSKGVG